MARQFDPSGSAPLACTPENFVKEVNAAYIAAGTSILTVYASSLLMQRSTGGESALKPGYAPFCKHFFMKAFFKVPVAAVRITDENQMLLRSAYQARTEAEMPVLTRWFREEDVEVPTAERLDVILYSR